MKYRVIRYDADCYVVQKQTWLSWKTLQYWMFEAGWIPYVFSTPEEAWTWIHEELDKSHVQPSTVSPAPGLWGTSRGLAVD